MKKFFPQLESAFAEFSSAVKGEKIAVAGHMRPDGDCVSSQLAIADILKQLGATDVLVVNKHPIPHLYEPFAYGKTFLDAESFTQDYKIVTVDCADTARVGENLATRFPQPFACIDHHYSNKSAAQMRIIDAEAAATAELIAGLTLDAGLEISKENANRLYMGICTDTRQFTTSSTRSKTFAIAKALVDAGADVDWVAQQLYQRESFAKIKLTSLCLDSFQLHFGGRACVGFLEADAFAKTGAVKADTDGLVDFARNIEGVQIAAILEQLADGVKGSLRAKTPELRVNEIAEKHGGGGHLAAAGFTVRGETLDSFLPKLLADIENQLK